VNCGIQIRWRAVVLGLGALLVQGARAEFGANGAALSRRHAPSTAIGRYAWPLTRGSHEVYTRIWDDAPDGPHETELVRFQVH
jgi:hypothetical protein